MCLLMAIPTYGMRACDFIQEAGISCEVITPVVTCGTYDMYNSTHELTIDDGAMTQIGSTGVYYFPFTQNDSGTHKIILCDNTTATIEVAGYSMKNLSDSFATLQAVGDSDWITATGFATATQLTSNVSNLQTYGDSNWATATGFSTVAQLNTNASTIISRGNSAWITATGFATSAEINALANITTTDLDTQCISETEMNLSHSTGNYSNIATSVSASVSASDRLAIANTTFNILNQNATGTFHNDSSGYPQYEIWSYDEIEVNLSYTYYSDGYTIYQRNTVRTP